MTGTARRIGIPLIGHAPVNLGLDEMLRAPQPVAHLGTLSNIYFLPLRSHMAVLLVTAGASLVLICIAFISGITAAIRRLTKNGRRNGSSAVFPGPRARNEGHENKGRHPVFSRVTTRKLTRLIAFAAAGAFICAFTYLPGGPLFSSTLLRLVFTILAGIITVAATIAGLAAFRLLLDGAASRLGTMQLILVATSSIALTVVLLAFWVPMSWRSSDRGIDGLAKRIHEAGIPVQSTLVVYDTLSTNGRMDLLADLVIDFLMPSVRQAWRQEPKRGIPLNRFTEFNQKVAGVLHRNGVSILAGTDALGLPLVAPGSSFHKELELLSASGLSASEVLRSATVVPAAFLGKSDEFGTIAMGHRADILLVAGNPLESLEVLKQPMADGSGQMALAGKAR